MVRGMLEAQRDGRMDDVVAHMDPDVEWRPLTRPGRALYRGHDGIREMHDIDDQFLGPRYMTVEGVTLADDGTVTGHGQLVQRGDDGEPSAVHYEAQCVLEDGLIVSVETRKRGGE